MSLVGMGLGDLMRLEAQASSTDVRPGKAKSVVFIFQSGGPSQHETFDPKPEAPDTIRGEYGVARTRTQSELFCEYLPSAGRQAFHHCRVASAAAAKFLSIPANTRL